MYLECYTLPYILGGYLEVRASFSVQEQAPDDEIYDAMLHPTTRSMILYLYLRLSEFLLKVQAWKNVDTDEARSPSFSLTHIPDSQRSSPSSVALRLDSWVDRKQKQQLVQRETWPENLEQRDAINKGQIPLVSLGFGRISQAPEPK